MALEVVGAHSEGILSFAMLVPDQGLAALKAKHQLPLIVKVQPGKLLLPVFIEVTLAFLVGVGGLSSWFLPWGDHAYSKSRGPPDPNALAPLPAPHTEVPPLMRGAGRGAAHQAKGDHPT
jgi:hypothetical protein